MGSAASKSMAKNVVLSSSRVDVNSTSNTANTQLNYMRDSAVIEKRPLAQTIPNIVVSAKRIAAAKKREKDEAIKKVLMEYPELADSLKCVREYMKEIEQEKEADIGKKIMSLRTAKWLEELYNLYFEHDQREHKRIIADQLAQDKGGHIFTEYMKALTENGTNTPTEGYTHSCLVMLRSVCWNYSDASLDFCVALGRMGAFPLFAADLVTFKSKIEDENIRVNIILPCVSILHNCAKSPDNKRWFKEAKAVEAIVPYTNFDYPEIKMVAMMTLAYIIDEKDNNVISADGSMIKYILHYLQSAINGHDHKFDGFSAEEIVSGLMHLASNDNNKEAIVEQGVLPMLVKLLEEGSEPEKAISAETVWVLTFRDQNKSKIREEKNMMTILEKLENSPGPARASASGALWVLNEEERVQEIKNMNSSMDLGSFSFSFPKKKNKSKTKGKIKVRAEKFVAEKNNFKSPKDSLENSELYGDDSESDAPSDVEEEQRQAPTGELGPAVPTQSQPTKHVMISYQWDCQKLMMRVKDRLQKLNYNVWIDVESMGGSTLQVSFTRVSELTPADRPNCVTTSQCPQTIE